MKKKKLLFILLPIISALCIGAFFVYTNGLTTPNPHITCIESSGKPEISWSAVEGAGKYEIWRSATGKAVSFKKIHTTETTSFADTTAVAGEKYFYKVKSVSGIKGAFSHPVNIVCTLAAPELTDFSNDAITGKIIINWNAVEGASEYEVYRSETGEEGSFQLIADTASASFTDKDTAAGAVYYYKVKAIHANSVADSVLSSARSHICVLPSPTGLTLSNIGKTGKIQLKWSPVEDASEYAVYRSETGEEGSFTFLSGTEKTSFTDSTALAGSTYHYKVTAVHSNAEAESAFSAAEKQVCILAKPVISNLYRNASGVAVMEWTAVEGASVYEIYRSTTGEDGSFKLLSETASAAFADENASTDKIYYYKVKAIHSDKDANSKLSDSHMLSSKLSSPVITIETNQDGNPVIRWERQYNATGYEIYRAVNENGIYRKLSTAKGNSYVSTDIFDGAEYFYRIKALAKSETDSSDFSNTVSFIKGGTPAEFTTAYVSSLMITAYAEPVKGYEPVVIPYMYEVQLGPTISQSPKGSWIQIKHQDKTLYIVAEECASSFTDTQSSFDYIKPEHTAIQNEILELAMSWLDKPTCYILNALPGDIDLATGKYAFDCSGFAKYVIDTVMSRYVPCFFLTTNITDLYCYGPLYNKGFNNQFDAIDVPLEEIRPGDVVFFKLNENDPKIVTHCGIYMGNDEYIHCTDATDGVFIAPLNEIRREKIVGVKRYYPDKVEPANQPIRNTEKRKVAIFSEPDTESLQIGKVAKSGEVTLLFTTITENWGYVQTADGQNGYVLMRYFEAVQ
ncbi:MAG: C40 family peptidase [Oscillospiraceae bacterium]|nr:C40 family peptidase [Oscillospiraceae bacterium]